MHSIFGRKPAIVSTVGPKIRPSRRAVIAGGGIAAIAAAGGGWLLLAPAKAKAHTIAVLPFANLSGDPSQNYFSDGNGRRIAQRTRGPWRPESRRPHVLGNAEECRCGFSCTATGRCQHHNRELPALADHRPRQRQLVDGKSGLEQWSQSFDRPFGDVLAIQSDIASNVARALSIELDSTTRAVLSSRGTNNPEAQDLLLQATTAQRDDSESGLLTTIALLDQAIELDSIMQTRTGRKLSFSRYWQAPMRPA